MRYALVVALAFLALARQAAAGDPIIEAEGPADRRATIRFQFWGGATELEQFTAIAQAFVRRHPGVRVQLSVLPWGQYWSKLQTQAAGNIAPDVIRLYSGAAADWFDRGVLLDLTPLVEREGVRRDLYFPVALEACSWKGRLYSLPSDVPLRVLIYNKDLFDRAGLSGEYPHPAEPLTWEQFLGLARRLTIFHDGRPAQFGFSLGPQLDVILIHQAGGRLVDRPVAPTRSTADTPETAAGLRFYYDLQYTHRVAPDIGAQQEMGFGGGETPLLSGRIAMGMAGPWALKAYRQAGMRLGLAPLFRGPRRAQVCTPNSNGVYRLSRHPEEAWRFVKFVASEEGQTLVARLGVGTPAMRHVAGSPAFTDHAAGFRNLEAYAADLEHAEPLVMTPTPDILAAVERVTGDLRRRRDVTPESAARMLHERISLALERLQPRPPSFHSRVTGPLAILVLTALAFAGVVWGARRAVGPPRREASGPGAAAAWLFLAPWLFGLVVFNLGPIAAAAGLSFTEWDMIRSPVWVGVRNYADILFRDPTFLAALKVTALYALFSVPLTVGGGLATAWLLHHPSRLAGAVRAVVYLPSLLSGVAVTLLWKWMYNPSSGVINHFIELAGGRGPDWLDDPAWVLPALVLMNVLWVGGNTIVFHAALDGVPPSLYDAARVDGAGAWRRFRHVTLPLVSPAVLFATVTGVIQACQAFTPAFMLRSERSDVGGPSDASMLYVLYVYRKAFMEFKMGYACALALILFVLIFGLTWLQLRGSRRWIYYEA